MFVTKVSRMLNGKDWTVLQRLNQGRKCTLMTTKQNDIYSVYKIFNYNRYLASLCTLNQLKTFSTQPAFSISETLYARNVLEKSDHHSNSLVYSMIIKEDSSTDEIEHIVNKQWISMSNTEILENFQVLSYYASNQNICVTNPQYQGIFEVLENRLATFSDEELHNLLNYMNLWNNEKYRSDYKGFWKELDEECLKRSSSWDLEKKLLMNDHFYKLRLLKKSKFTYNSLQTLDPTTMSPANLLQYTFLLKVNERIPLNLEKLEYSLEKWANKFTIEELGIIAMTFFKYENRIKSKQFVILFIDKLIHNIDDVGDIALSAILKILRYSVFLEIGPHFTLLLDALVTQVPKRRLITLTHIAHLQGATLKYNKELISQIVNRYEKEIEFARIKDIERILFTLYTFAYDPKSTPFYTLAKDEFLNPAREEELKKYPRVFVYSIMYMLHMNMYPVELLKHIMHPDYIRKFSYGNLSALNREYLFMDYSIQVECPQYDGPRLEKYIRNSLVMKYGSGSIEMKMNQTSKLIKDVANVCKGLTNSKSAVYIHSLLPHFVANNIILCYDEQKKKFLNPGGHFRNFVMHDIKYAPNDGKKWYALVMGTHNLITRNTYEPTGLLTAHMRQLKCIGYIPILIIYSEWQNAQTDARKLKFLKILLNL